MVNILYTNSYLVGIQDNKDVLEITLKRGEAKRKGEKKRYTHLNAEFQRIARRDKKAFLSDQCKEKRGKQ